MVDLREIDGMYFIPLDEHDTMYDALFHVYSDAINTWKSEHEELQGLRKENAELRKENTRLKRIERRQQKRWASEKERE